MINEWSTHKMSLCEPQRSHCKGSLRTWLHSRRTHFWAILWRCSCPRFRFVQKMVWDCASQRVRHHQALRWQVFNKYMEQGSGCSTVVKRTPQEQKTTEVVGSNPVWCWAFFFFFFHLSPHNKSGPLKRRISTNLEAKKCISSCAVQGKTS